MTHERPSWTDDGTGKPNWDERYRASDQVWSGNPNGALVAQVGGLRPGAALDVGCGEGADAIWLSEQGWLVTALDVSKVALDRAQEAAELAGVEVAWVHSALETATLPPDGFDLVSAQYPALPKTVDGAALRALLDSVAVGGTLLFVHHALIGSEEAKAHGFDPEDFLSPDDVEAAIRDSWDVTTFERRSREIDGGSGAHHVEDIVLRATQR